MAMNTFFRRPTLLLAALLSGITLHAQVFQTASIDAGLLSELERSAPDTYHGAFVLLKDRVEPQSFEQSLLRANVPQEKRTALLLEALQAKAKQSQQPILDLIRQSPDVDQAQLQSYWIANMLFVRAKKGFFAALSQRPDVAWIEKNEALEINSPPSAPVAAPMVPNGREPGLNAINAPALWALGYTGYGRKILIVDSGQDSEHPALRNQFAYNYAPQTSTFLSTALPDFCDSHGTGVASAAVGLDPVTRDTVGVAFNAKWMGGPFSNLRSVDSGEFCDYRGAVKDVASVLQWALNPDGNVSTTSDMPDVVNNSYGRKPSSITECSQVWPELFRSLDAAGIAIVFAAGNDGPGPSTANLQAAISINDVTPLSVGAVNGSNSLIASFSGRGPAFCTNYQNPSWDFKPEVAAPGVSVRVATTSRAGYESVNGTSFAAPYVAGAILLLKEAFPNVPGRELARALYNSATDIGTPGEDNDSGKGIINVLAAYNYLIANGLKPTAPAASNIDVATLSATPRILNCGGQLYLDVAFLNAGKEILKSLDIIVRREFSSTPMATIKWTGNLQPGASTTYTLPEFPAGFGGYTIEVELRNPNGKTDDRPLNNQLKRKATVTPQPLLPPLSVATPTVCSTGRNLITTPYTGNGVLRWYNRSEGGTALAQGTSFYTGPLNSDTTFFAELRFNEKAGKTDNTTGVAALSDSTTGGLVFDCLAPFTLRSVLVYASVAGPRNVRLRRPDGSIQQRLVNVSRTGATRLTLDFSIDVGEGYVLDISVGRELSVSKTEVTYPYTIPGVLSIRAASGQDPLVYPLFYDWEVEYNYPCGRVPARIAVDKSTTGVKAAFTSPDTVTISNGAAVVTFKNSSTSASQFNWVLGDGNSSREENPIHTYRSPGKYQVILTATSGTCSDVAFRSVSVASITGLGDLAQAGGQLRVYPNPAQTSAQIDLQLATPDEVRVLLFDLLGRKLQQWELGRVAEVNTELDLSRYPSGTYQLLFIGNTFQQGQKLWIQR